MFQGAEERAHERQAIINSGTRKMRQSSPLFPDRLVWCRPCSVCFVRFALSFLFLCAFVPCGWTMELGQTKDSIVAQHGPATEENHSKNTAVYRSGSWKVDLQFRDGIACRLTFSKV